MRAASDQLDCARGEWLGTVTLGRERSVGLNDDEILCPQIEDTGWELSLTS